MPIFAWTAPLEPPSPVRLRRAGFEGLWHAPDWRERFAQAYRAQLQAWIDAVASSACAGASAWDGYAAMAVAEAALSSLDGGRPIEVRLEPRPGLYG